MAIIFVYNSNKVNRHFHCTSGNCHYSFVQYSTMAIHKQKHADEVHKKEIRRTPEMAIKKEIEERPSSAVSSGVPQENYFRAINLSSQLSPENKVSGVLNFKYSHNCNKIMHAI